MSFGVVGTEKEEDQVAAGDGDYVGPFLRNNNSSIFFFPGCFPFPYRFRFPADFCRPPPLWTVASGSGPGMVATETSQNGNRPIHHGYTNGPPQGKRKRAMKNILYCIVWGLFIKMSFILNCNNKSH